MAQRVIMIKWGTSRGHATYGYTTCSLWENGVRRTGCNGGGYDMRGTVVGDWLAATFADRLRTLTTGFYGLQFLDPTFDPGAFVPDVEDGRTVAQREAAGVSAGLERYQVRLEAMSDVPTARHTSVSLAGACGLESMLTIAKAIGVTLTRISKNAKEEIYLVAVEGEV